MQFKLTQKNDIKCIHGCAKLQCCTSFIDVVVCGGQLMGKVNRYLVKGFSR